MTIENTDVLLVNRGDTSHKIKYENLKTSITDSVEQFPEAPEDGKQYGRKDATWTEVVHTPPYTNSDVDSHLNIASANADQVLSWSGSDYEWKNPPTGGGGGGGTTDPNFIQYTYPTGQQRTLQHRLEDYVSVKDFGAVGDGVADDTVAIAAAMRNTFSKSIYFPSGNYNVTESIEIDTALTIFGDGMASAIYYRPTAEEHINKACLRFRVDLGEFQEEDYFELHNIQILCGYNQTTAGGVALIDGGDGPITGPFNKLTIDNVTIGAEWLPGLGTSGYFVKGLFIANVGGVTASNLTIQTSIVGDPPNSSRENPDAAGITIVSSKGRATIRAFQCTNFYIQDYYTAMNVTSPNGSIESVYMSHGEVKGRQGFIFGQCSATYLAGIHFDTWREAIAHNGDGGVHRIIGCDIRADDAQPWDGFLVSLNANQIIFANNFLDSGGVNGARGGLIACNRVSPLTNENISITDNIMHGGFSSNYLALLVQSGTKNITFGGNTFYDFGGNNEPWANLAGNELYIYGQRGYN